MFRWAKKLRQGRSDDPATTLGPLVKASAADFVWQQIQEPIAQGAVTHISSNDYPLDSPDSSTQSASGK